MKHEGQKLKVEYGKYHDGRTAISLICDGGEDNGQPYMVASLNLPEARIKENQVVIKSYAENEGILEVLEEEGIVERTDYFVIIGHTRNFICNILKK